MINESNISNNEREYRQFCELIKVYAPGKSISDVTVRKTTRGNYRVYVDGKFIKLVSKNIVNDKMILQYGIKVDLCPEC